MGRVHRRAKYKTLLAAPAPSRLRAAIVGNADLFSAGGKRLDVNFEPARFIGLICDPFSVGRKLSVALFKVRLNDWKRLPVFADRHGPDVPIRFQSEVSEEEKAAIGGPIRCMFGL
jgi:hypothetical protein